tara:strand:+ start:1257 stop:3359 length:2103 start_codon:yes stop_codon:yes gene_type:complete
MAANVFNDQHFADNVKLEFGQHTNGVADFTIFHNAPGAASTSNIISAIRNAGGSGPVPKPIKMLADEINFIGQNDNLADFVETGSGNSVVKLYANSSVKFETTGSGVSVTGKVTISTIDNASSDTDKFLVSDSGVVKYRTGAQVRSDIGAGTGNGTVTSVGLTMPSAFTVSSSPVTTSGTIAVTGAGTTSQYIRGDGSLATFTSGMSSWNLRGDSGGTASIVDGDTVDIEGGDGIDTTRSSDTITVDVDSTVVRTSGPQTINGTKTFGTVPDVGTRGLSDNTTFAASTAWVQSQNYGTVSSVALTETGSALTITGSPVTSSGTINIAGAGTSSQVILGNLSLATLPVDGVTSIATNAPITGGTITSTGTIGITQATTSSNGYLSSTDWNTFNNKGSGSVTSVATGTGLTGGTITTSGTISVDSTVVLTNNTQTISGAKTISDTLTMSADIDFESSNASILLGASSTLQVDGDSGVGGFLKSVSGGLQWTTITQNAGTVTSVSAANPTTGGATNNPLFISGSTTVNPTINFNRNLVQDLPNLITTESSSAVGGGVTTGTWNANTQLDKTSNTDNSFQGEVVYFGSVSGSTATGKLYVLTTPDGEWQATLANSVSKVAGLLGIALGTSGSDGFLTRGMFTLSYVSTGSSAGSPLYLSSTSSGTVTHEPPSGTGAFVRIIGTQIDATNGQIFFHPDNTFIELS